MAVRACLLFGCWFNGDLLFRLLVCLLFCCRTCWIDLVALIVGCLCDYFAVCWLGFVVARVCLFDGVCGLLILLICRFDC